MIGGGVAPPPPVPGPAMPPTMPATAAPPAITVTTPTARPVAAAAAKPAGARIDAPVEAENTVTGARRAEGRDLAVAALGLVLHHDRLDLARSGSRRTRWSWTGRST